MRPKGEGGVEAERASLSGKKEPPPGGRRRWGEGVTERKEKVELNNLEERGNSPRFHFEGERSGTVQYQSPVARG
jgi:hypothetical protein